MADRIVLELKDKVATLAAPEEEAPAPAATTSFATEQVVEALVGLGFPERSARPVVDAIAAEQPDAASSALLRAALTQLGKK